MIFMIGSWLTIVTTLLVIWKKCFQHYQVKNTCYGKILKKGPEEYEDVKGLVTADYQEELEKGWVATLRRKYQVKVYDEVVKTVNKH